MLKIYDLLVNWYIVKNYIRFFVRNFCISGYPTFWLEDNNVMKNGEIVRMNYSSSLDRLISGDRIGIRRTAEGVLRFFVNGEDLGIAETDLPLKVRHAFWFFPHKAIEMFLHFRSMLWLNYLEAQSQWLLSARPQIQNLRKLLIYR